MATKQPKISRTSGVRFSLSSLRSCFPFLFPCPKKPWSRLLKSLLIWIGLTDWSCFRHHYFSLSPTSPLYCSQSCSQSRLHPSYARPSSPLCCFHPPCNLRFLQHHSSDSGSGSSPDANTGTTASGSSCAATHGALHTHRPIVARGQKPQRHSPHQCAIHGVAAPFTHHRPATVENGKKCSDWYSPPLGAR